eukprot:gene8368-biopygen4627
MPCAQAAREHRKCGVRAGHRDCGVRWRRPLALACAQPGAAIPQGVRQRLSHRPTSTIRGRNGSGRVPDASCMLEFEETDASRMRPGRVIGRFSRQPCRLEPSSSLRTPALSSPATPSPQHL